MVGVRKTFCMLIYVFLCKACIVHVFTHKVQYILICFLFNNFMYPLSKPTPPNVSGAVLVLR